MKTKLLFAGLLLASFFNSNAQTTTVYSNDFTTAGVAPNNLTIIDGDADTANWGLYTGNATTLAWGLTGNFAGSRSWNPATATPPGPLTPNNFLLTPSIAIPTTFGTTALSFKLGSNDVDFPEEQISLYLAPATATTAAQIAALTPVFNRTLDASNALTAITYTVDVSSYAGQSVKIVMRHHGCTDQDLLYFDDILLTQTVLGTEQFAASQFAVSPNPASSVINVDSKVNSNITAVSLTDLNGRTVKQVSFSNLSNVQVNISDLASGVYMMNITSKEGTGTKKIVKN